MVTASSLFAILAYERFTGMSYFQTVGDAWITGENGVRRRDPEQQTDAYWTKLSRGHACSVWPGILSTGSAQKSI